MATVANIKNSEGSHYYYPDGTPCYSLPKKDGSGMPLGVGLEVHEEIT